MSIERTKTNQVDLSRDIKEMMYGFGDNWPPDDEAVSLVEMLVKEYVEELGIRALDIAELRGKLDKECFMFIVRKDTRKFSRIKTLLETNEKLEEAQKVSMTEVADINDDQF